MNRLTGRRCIITGASRGLGASIARTFWSQGASLFVVARTEGALNRLTDELGERPGQRIHLLACDLADPETPGRIVEEARRALGGVSVLVNNAGLQGPIGPVWENDWSQW